MSDIRSRVSEAEWQTRTDLAAVFRLAARHDLADLALTHFAARVPDEPDRFLLNPYGLMFEEITASSLVKTDREGGDPLETGRPLNAVGVLLHSAILDARPDVACTAHTHTVAGMALASLDAELLPMSQTAMLFHGPRTGYHDWESDEEALDERARLARDLGPEGRALVLKNHGLLAAGPSVPCAWGAALRAGARLRLAAGRHGGGPGARRGAGIAAAGGGGAHGAAVRRVSGLALARRRLAGLSRHAGPRGSELQGVATA